MDMPHYLSRAVVLCLAMSAAAVARAEPSAPGRQPLPFLRADGSRIVDASGSPVLLKGCNLGNWLLLEPWMFGGSLTARDQAGIFSTLSERFGTDGRDRLLDIY